MATQEWTIFTIVGTASAEIQRRLRSWSSARTSDDATAWEFAEWPRRTRVSAQRLMEALLRHKAASPVVFFSQHIDLWSSFGDLFRFIPSGAPDAITDDGACVWSYRLPDRGRLARRARQVRATHQFDEYLWLANALEAAAKAYQGLWRESLLLIQRRAWTVSPSDEELVAMASVRPRWLWRREA